MFSQAFLHFLIGLSLAWTVVGVLVLLGLFIRDYRQGKLW